ncbi:DUF924 family protein [Ottowia sp.]|uniref:DUF924 family protein n=1 Tax=Ottowia sp. TaxID=1898956 RepID=UPI002CAC37F7|nr:DUF924 family protein [Ottowia sp.]HOB65511.1 DUF924 family protein [Ottowia sp.]HPZ57249.1 DUF924 family protein [Ottowia sp.]HQD48909.1 DUF924 family protein [Ottowia sp.]
MNEPLATAADVVTFWFGAAPPHDAAALGRQRAWFTKSDAFDAEIRARFAPIIHTALAGGCHAWAQDAQGWLALIVVLDQFTRNVFRGDAKAFAGDAAARDLAEAGIARGWDAGLPFMARPFVYLPFEHAEDLATQHRSVDWFSALLAEARAASAPEAVLTTLASNLDYAQRHLDVIARFGRFPHRNAILGRASTAEELVYLAQPGAGF